MQQMYGTAIASPPVPAGVVVILALSAVFRQGTYLRAEAEGVV